MESNVDQAADKMETNLKVIKEMHSFDEIQGKDYEYLFL